MNHQALLAIALAFGPLPATLPRASAAEPHPEEAGFINAYLQAHAAKDLELALRLFSSELGGEEKKQIRVILSHAFKIPIKSIELSPRNPQPLQGDRDGIAQKPEMEITNNLIIRFAPNTDGYDAISFPVASKGGKLFIAAWKK